MNIVEHAAQMLKEHPLCNHCLGRQFALLAHGVENESRGEAIKLLLTMMGHKLALAKDETGIVLLRAVAANETSDIASSVLKRFNKRAQAEKLCFLCEGKFEVVSSFAEIVKKRLKRYEFATFLVGVELPLNVAEREDEFKARFNITHGESMKSQFSRTIGKQICEETSKEVDFKTPDLVALVSPFTGRARLQINPLFIAGRYRKLVRNIPQSRWLCGECGGKGCESCNWTGKKYLESVEELIGTPTLNMVQGKTFILHGAGREDIDVRVLGKGRPFVLEVKEPKKRFINLQKLEQVVNEFASGKVEVHGLRFADKNIVRRVKKAEATEKIYRVVVRFDRDVSNEELKEIKKALSNATISQQTPRRVLHRRADLTREKYIYKTQVKRLSNYRAELRIHCQGGLYVKELVTGDQGRTSPSIANILGAEATPIQLDVLSVRAGEEE